MIWRKDERSYWLDAPGDPLRHGARAVQFDGCAAWDMCRRLSDRRIKVVTAGLANTIANARIGAEKVLT